VIERCPRCREPLLTLNWSMLKRCDVCDGYVEPDGEWVERREGDIRYADAMTRGEPKSVAELAEVLRSPAETFREDLAELCRRHRRAQRRAFEEPHEWLTVSIVGEGDGGYREASEAELQRVSVAQRRIGRRQALRGCFVVSAVMVLSGLAILFGGARGPLQGVGAMLITFPLFIGFVAGLGALIERFVPPTRRLRVQAIERRKGAPRLSVRTTNGETHELLAEHTRVSVAKDSGGEGGPTYTAWLNGPHLSAKLVLSGDRTVIQRFVRRLEYVIGLDSLPPR